MNQHINSKSLAIIFKYDKLNGAFMVLSFFLAGIIPPLGTLFLERVIASVEQHTQFMVVLWVVMLAVLMILNLVNQHLTEYATMKLTHNLSIQFESDFLVQLEKIEFSCYEDAQLHDKINRFSNPAKSVTDSFISLLRLPSQIISVISYTGLFWIVSPWFIPVIALLFAISMFFSIREVKNLRKLRIKQTVEERKANYVGSLFTDKKALKEMKLFDSSTYLNHMYSSLSGHAIDCRLEITRKGFWGGIISQIANFIFLIGGIVFLIYLARNAKVEMSQVIALSSALPILCTYAAWKLPLSVADLKQKNEICKDYNMILDCPVIRQGTKSVTGNYTIQFKDVYFTYPGTDKQILKGFNATINPNENTAIVGINGCGKSTIIKLLLGLYHVNQGEITVGNTNIEDISEAEKKKLFTAVFQDFSIYQMSIQENIIISDIDTEPDLQRIKDALHYSNSSDVINKLPEGIETAIGQLSENGVMLSGGEEQRIAIARGLYSKSEYLILDEPTAALDPKAECQMYEEFSEMFRKRSCIIISHRLATAKITDNILLIEDGKLKEHGTHEELLALSGKYAQMFYAQAEWYQDKTDISLTEKGDIDVLEES